LPDPVDEGDLILHGSHLFDRVEELHKGKVEKEEDKMVLSVGREYLRRVHKYIEKTTDFKILPDLCRDSEHLNSTKRWEIRIRPTKQSRFISWLSTDGQQEKQSAAQPDQIQQAKNTKQNDPITIQSNSTHENVTDAPIEIDHRNDFETKREEYYKHVGNNFARLLMKKYRKEKLEKEEIDYLDHWIGEESIHWGMMGIYCHEGENVEEITKRIGTFIEEKQ